MKDQGVFMEHAPSFSDKNSAQFISSNLFQQVSFPKEYPAILLVHQEHPAQSVPLHWHDGPELIYPRNRELTVTIDGQKNVVHPGEFILISSFALHSVVPAPSPVRQDVLGMTFQANYLERVSPELKNILISRDAPGATKQAKQEMTSLCEQMRQHLEQRSDGQQYHFTTNRILFSILQLMYSDFVVPERQTNRKKIEALGKFTQVLEYIRHHYQEDITTQSIADHFGYTREYFCRIFKRYANQTFKQYLFELRLDAAVTELRASDQKIGQLAMKHGFRDEKSFFTAFKKKYGVTPLQFRKGL